MKILDYTYTSGTPCHVAGGILLALVAGPLAAGCFWGACMLIYQLYDSLPRQCLDWLHTKWDVLEMGFGAMVAGLVIRIAMVVIG